MVKKIVLFVFMVVILLYGFVMLQPEEQNSEDFVRIHIRANSNSVEDQNVKLLVRDYVVTYLSERLENSQNKAMSMQILREEIKNLEKITTGVLRANNFYYSVNIDLRTEEFPMRCYDNLVLDAGVYDALIIELGSAEGDNWWCVVYPPYCFSSCEDADIVRYRSRILELLKS